jgi:hypothetical protein
MFRFSTRDLLWLTLVVGLGLGWFVEHRQLQATADHAQARADSLHREARKWRRIAGNFGDALRKADWQTYTYKFCELTSTDE